MSSEQPPSSVVIETPAGRVIGSRSTVMVLLMLCFAGAAYGGDVPPYHFDYVRTILGPCCADYGTDLMIADDGGVLVAGTRGSLDLDRDGTVDVKSFGSKDPLILKSDDGDSGKGWVQGPGGPKRDAATGVAPDRHGGAFAVGGFSESMHIAGGQIFSLGREDGFLARYDENGETQWARPIGGVGRDNVFDVSSDEAGNAYVIGTIRGSVDVDRDGTVDVTPAGESAVLLASFDPDGTLRWARASAGDAGALGRAIAIGPGGAIYVGGFYGGGTFDLDGDNEADAPAAGNGVETTTMTSRSDLNGFYARFDSSGSMIWTRSVSGPAVQAVGSLAVAGNGDLLVLGGYTDWVDLDADGVADVEFRSMADRKWEHHEDINTFLIRVAPDGQRRWVQRYTAVAIHVAAGRTRIVLSGSYDGLLDLDDDGKPEREADPDSQLEGFAAILDGEGRIRHVFTVVGSDSDVVNAAGFSADGKKLYVTGYTKLGADFDGDGTIESASACHQLGDFYLARYDVEE